MPITLPDLKDTRCASFASCGHIQTKDQEVLEWLKKQPDWMAARQRYKKGSVYVRAGFGGKKGAHCHVEVVEPSFFTKPPKVTGTVSKIQEILSRLMGQKIKCDLSGEFHLEGSELPRFVHAMLLDIEEDNVSFRMTAGRFEVTGAPVRSIAWAVNKESGSAWLKIEATQSTVVSETYLVDGFQVILSGFTAFIGGGTPRGEG
jgi:hypothetical protein